MAEVSFFSTTTDVIRVFFRLAALREALCLGAGCSFSVSLQRMTKALLCEDIQTGAHSSLENAWAMIRLFSLKPSKIPVNVILLPLGKRKKQPFKWVATTSMDYLAKAGNDKERAESKYTFAKSVVV